LAEVSVLFAGLVLSFALNLPKLGAMLGVGNSLLAASAITSLSVAFLVARRHFNAEARARRRRKKRKLVRQIAEEQGCSRLAVYLAQSRRWSMFKNDAARGVSRHSKTASMAAAAISVPFD